MEAGKGERAGAGSREAGREGKGDRGSRGKRPDEREGRVALSHTASEHGKCDFGLLKEF